MNTTPEQKQTGPLLIRSVSSPSVKVIYLDREAVRENLKGPAVALGTAQRDPRSGDESACFLLKDLSLSA
jgi:hypothetical protein